VINCAKLTTNDRLSVLPQSVEKEPISRSARAVSVPWRGRETGNVRYLSCLLPSLVMRAPDCLDSPVDEPDEEHASPGECKQRER
jgi:hypothetical protein